MITFNIKESDGSYDYVSRTRNWNIKHRRGLPACKVICIDGRKLSFSYIDGWPIRNKVHR